MTVFRVVVVSNTEYLCRTIQTEIQLEMLPLIISFELSFNLFSIFVICQNILKYSLQSFRKCFLVLLKINAFVHSLVKYIVHWTSERAWQIFVITFYDNYISFWLSLCNIIILEAFVKMLF